MHGSKNRAAAAFFCFLEKSIPTNAKKISPVQGID